MNHARGIVLLTAFAVIASAGQARAGGGGGSWVEFTDETLTRLVAAPGLGINDQEEKDYAWGDVDKDGDIDIICVRKEPFTTAGRRQNVFFMNEGISDGHPIDGVFVDRTALFVSAADDGGQGFLDDTNDRDVTLADVNGDTWLDIVTAPTLGEGLGLSKSITHPRIYINLGEDGGGNWLGFEYQEARIPQLTHISGSPNAPGRFCSVSAGDVTGDDRPEIYLGDYDSGPGAHTDLNDRLLINDGNGNFTDSFETRMDSQMLLSAFGMATAIADMNGDGVNDIVKDTALASPRRISISYNDPNNEGFFNAFDVVYEISAYHITVGHLNQDNLLDIVVTDDGGDRYMINDGNAPNGRPTFTTLAFLGTDNNFGGNSVIADFNQDGWNDVLIGDVDVDAPGCSRGSHMYRNLGDGPNVTLQEQGDPTPPWVPDGIHDIAVFDINGDSYPDMFMGTCAGTTVWINVPPTDIQFSYPDGLPGEVVPDTETMFRVVMTGVGTTPLAGTGKQFVSIDNGPFVETMMPQDGGTGDYTATLPAVPCTSTLRFYFAVDTTSAGTVTDPGNAPTTSYSALSSLGTTIDIDERFEAATPSWTVTNDASLTGGGWERVNPIGTDFPPGSGTPAQPEDDFGAPQEELNCFITEQYPGSGTASNNDVDGGPTTLTSPTFDLDGTDGIVTYSRWLFCSDQGTADEDALITEINNGGGWVQVHQTFGTGSNWEAVSFKVSDFVTPTATLQVRFSVSDPSSSVTEAGIDNFVVTRIVCPIPCAGPGDCDDGLFCNGVETCGIDGFCASGTSPCLGQACDEINDQCVACNDNSDCDDGQFCNGAEICNASNCEPGVDPCAGLGLTCDEANDVCVGCITAGDCDDGLYCNGVERCLESSCYPALGVGNDGFDGSNGWTDNIPIDGNITYLGELDITGPDSSTGGFTWASQAVVDLNGANLEFDLLSYTSTDTGNYDRPALYIDGTFYGLNDNGTIGSAMPNPPDGGAYGNIDNSNQQTTTVHFVIDVEALVGAGQHEIGFAVGSRDGILGNGFFEVDNVLPVAGPADPCPGLFCDEATDSCAACLTDGHCDDGLFCNGAEQCSAGACSQGVPPCPAPECDEVTDTCSDPVQPAMGEPVSGLTAGELAAFIAGQEKFELTLLEADGLGPVFNQNSCGSCHNNTAVGGSGATLVTRFGFASKGGFDPLTQFGGSLLQGSAVSIGCEEVVPVEANIVANRVTPSVFGAGLVEAIPDADLIANEITPPPGVSGATHMVQPLEDPTGPLRVGRFGWKCQVATVLTFSGDASLNEMGLTNRLVPNENDPNGIRPPDLATCDTVADPEDGPEDGIPGNPHFIDRITDFQRLLAPPPQTPKSGMTGEVLFNSIGCVDCHIQSFTTGATAEAALSNKTIKPYSDFLLHDMGQLGDGIVQGTASETEIRTASLWGLRVRDPLLHDGRIIGGTFESRIRGAILEHGATGSEAAASEAAFNALLPSEQDAIIAFLDSLGRREFDHDGDNDVDPVDLDGFANCFTGPGNFYTPDDPCSVSDIDQDGDVDDDDFNLFLTVYSGSQGDCNTNSVNDAEDILVGTSSDCNLNGIPDECDPDSTNVALFVAQLLLDVQDPELVCLFDQDGNVFLNGDDIQMFVDNLLSP